jgi:hypothetical protein
MYRFNEFGSDAKAGVAWLPVNETRPVSKIDTVNSEIRRVSVFEKLKNFP